MEIKHKRYIYLTENVSYMLSYLIKKSPRIIKFFNIDYKQKMYAASNHFKIKVALHPLRKEKNEGRGEDCIHSRRHSIEFNQQSVRP